MATTQTFWDRLTREEREQVQKYIEKRRKKNGKSVLTVDGYLIYNGSINIRSDNYENNINKIYIEKTTLIKESDPAWFERATILSNNESIDIYKAEQFGTQEFEDFCNGTTNVWRYRHFFIADKDFNEDSITKVVEALKAAIISTNKLSIENEQKYIARAKERANECEQIIKKVKRMSISPSRMDKLLSQHKEAVKCAKNQKTSAK